MRATPKRVLWLLSACALLEGLFDAHAMAPGTRASLLPLASALALSYLSFCWYRLDSEARGYRRSRWLNSGVVALTLVAIPYYLARSRPRGQKLRALLRLIGFFLLQCLAAFVGALVGTLAFGLA